LVALISFLIIAPPKVHAITDQKSATISATATVPSTAATTGDTTAPSNPILVRPEDGTITGDNRSEFVWRSSTDPNGNTVTYTLYLNGVATYLGISNLGNSASTGYTARIDGQEIKLHPTVSLLDGVYDWYVTASDPSGNTSRSASWHLTVDTVAPPLTLTDLDDYHNPVITEGSNFDITGPKDIGFRVRSDPFVEIQITLSPSSELLYLNSITNADGFAYLYQHLSPGVYTVTIVGVDRAANTSVFPDFTLTVTQAAITISLPTTPGSTPTQVISLPYTPISLASLPATISNIQTRLSLPYLIIGLLAISIILLLIIISKRRYNLILLDSNFSALDHGTVYHSNQRPRPLTFHLPSTIYNLRSPDHGRLYIPHLGRYSTFTVRLDKVTYIFSMSTNRKLYTVVLG